MSVPLIPAPLPELARRPFAFHPPIGGLKANEWVLRRSGWHDVHVLNTVTSEEVAVARRFVGEVEESEEGALVVRLTEALEHKHGRALPRRRGVIEMPAETRDAAAFRRRGPERPASVVTIRVEPPAAPRWRRALRGSVALGFLACLAVVFVIRDAHLGSRLGISSPVRRDLGLQAGDDYDTVVNKLGRPSSDRWLDAGNGHGYRRLWYPRRRMAVILSGETRTSAEYAGTLGRDGSIVHSANPSGLDELVMGAVWR